MIQNITDLTRKLARGTVRSVDLVTEALERIADPGGQGRLVFLKTYADAALAEAARVDAARAKGHPLPRFADEALSGMIAATNGGDNGNYTRVLPFELYTKENI